jgi:hypothetical protein
LALSQEGFKGRIAILRSKSAAVKEIIDEYLRSRKVQKIMSMKGKLSFDLTADEIRHYER